MGGDRQILASEWEREEEEEEDVFRKGESVGMEDKHGRLDSSALPRATWNACWATKTRWANPPGLK